MADIVISGKKHLNTICKEFSDQFPFLFLTFFTPQEWEKAQEGKERIHPIPGNQSLSAVRTKKAVRDEKEMSIHGRTLVKNIENNFLNTYGIYVQICYNKNGNNYYTSGDSDEMSLTQLNKKLSEEGATNIKENPQLWRKD